MERQFARVVKDGIAVTAISRAQMVDLRRRVAPPAQGGGGSQENALTSRRTRRGE
jgi:hypothetical protein